MNFTFSHVQEGCEPQCFCSWSGTLLLRVFCQVIMIHFAWNFPIDRYDELLSYPCHTKDVVRHHSTETKRSFTTMYFSLLFVAKNKQFVTEVMPRDGALGSNEFEEERLVLCTNKTLWWVLVDFANQQSFLKIHTTWWINL